MSRHLFVLLVATLGSGCRFPADYPLIPDRVFFLPNSNQQAVTYAVTAQHRFVIFTPGKDGDVRVCAEPSPDVGQSTTKLDQFGAALQVSDAQGKLANASGSVNSLDYYATAILLLTQRSQGLQIYRDGMYYYCQMYNQGAITKGEYFAKEQELRLAAEKIILAQMDKLPDLKDLPAPPTVAPQPFAVAPPTTPRAAAVPTNSESTSKP